jgi:hypothetical protein
MTRKHHVSTTLTLALALAGCGADGAQNIGDVAVLGANLSDYAGTWEGYAEAFQFADGADRVRVQLDENGIGVIEVGDSAALPEPDSTKGYPASGTFPGFENWGPFSHTFQNTLAPGFSYPIEAGLVEENRIRFETRSNELYRDWCEGMEPVLDTTNSGQNGNGDVYGCLPNEATATMFTGEEQTCDLGSQVIDCGLLSCQLVCGCDADSCSVFEYAEPDVKFDGALSDMGEALTGTLVMGERITLRFSRD